MYPRNMLNKIIGTSPLQRVLRLGGAAIVILALFFTWSYRPHGDLTLLQLLELYKREIDSPGMTLDNAAKHLETPEAARQFVLKRVSYSAYEGHRQTPRQVLRTRVANSVDKARLLGALLQRQGWKVSYRKANMPAHPPPRGGDASGERPSAVLREIAWRIGYDLRNIEREWRESASRADVVRKRVAELVARAEELLKQKAGLSLEAGKPIATHPQDGHILVVAKRNGRQLRLDPLYDDVKWPDDTTPYSMPVLARTLVSLRLVDRSGLEQSLLTWSGHLGMGQAEIRFLPAINTAAKMTGPADPTRIMTWIPVLNANGKVITGKPFTAAGDTPGISTRPPDIDPTTLKLARAADARTLRIAGIDASRWPRVSVSLDVRTNAALTWLPTHFQLFDNDTLQRTRLINIEQRLRPVLIVSDVSPSMQQIGAFELSKAAIIRLARRLPSATPVGLISFAWKPVNEVPVAALGDASAIINAARRLETRTWTGIYRALHAASRQRGMDDGVVVLLSDGEDNVGHVGEDEVIAALRARRIKVVALALGKNADTALLKRVAKKTDGKFLLIRNAKGLEQAYQRLGGILSSHVNLEYDFSYTGGGEFVREHKVRVSLVGGDLEAQGEYTLREKPRALRRPRLILHVTRQWRDAPVASTRELIDLAAPDAPWALTGVYTLIGDLGAFPARRLLSAYIGRWIRILRQRKKTARAAGTAAFSDAPPLEIMRVVNAFRAISTYNTPQGMMRSPAGPNHYLLRQWPLKKNGKMHLATVFDVLARSGRAYRFSGYWRAGSVVRLELASAVAEGEVISGANGVEELLRKPDKVRVLRRGDALPKWLAPGLARASGSLLTKEERLFVSPRAPEWMWRVNTGNTMHLRVYHGQGELYAKGASVEEIASHFDKIDKLYQIYTGIVGNLPGSYATTGAMLAAIATLKQAENKLWCFSTVMMGYVNEAISRQDALLSRSPREAQANAARLCKIQGGGGGDPSSTFQGLASEAARNGLKEWGVNAAKELAGGWPAAAHSLWNIGKGLYDLAHIQASTAPQTSNPMTPEFHKAMSRTVFQQ